MEVPTMVPEQVTGLADRFASMIQKQSSKRYAIRLVLSTFILSLIIILVWFTYWPTHFGFDNTYSKTELGVNGMYFWATLTSTVGFGDICPKTIQAKIFTTMYEMFMAIVGIGLMWELTDEAVHYQLNSKSRRSTSKL